jgi:glycosyltransferase involved in cell wall biosynthesis
VAFCISVVIPTHLRANLLREAIDSVLAQSFKPCEILVIDDANDEATRMVVEMANSKNDGIAVHHVINGDNAGACGSRNLGAECAVGDMLAFLDDDDLWYPTFLEQTVDALTDSGAEFAMSGLFRHEYGQTPAYRVMASGLTSADALNRPGSMTGSNLLIRRDVFIAIGGFDMQVAVFNDWDLFIRLVDADYRYAVCPAGLAEWRFHPGERIATPSLRRADGLLFFLQRYGHRMPRHVYRNFKTTELGIRRAHAARLGSRLQISFELMVQHGLMGMMRRTLARVPKIPTFNIRL